MPGSGTEILGVRDVVFPSAGYRAGASVPGDAVNSQAGGESDSGGAARPSTRDGRWLAQAAALALPVIILAVGGWVQRWTHEDAFINFRVVDQVFAGHGPVYNSGQRVEVTTSTLWFAWLVVARAMAGWITDIDTLSLVSGLAMATAGLVAGMVGAGRLARARARACVLIPAGAMAQACLAPVRDWATSGLETGMAVGWIGLCFAGLCARAVTGAEEPFSPVRRWGTPILIGLGVLVRPDFIVFAVAFGVAWLALSPPGWRGKLGSVAAAAAIPVVYQVFRMGYYASLVPNTALAKEGTGARWGQGWAYLVDTVRPYALIVPLAALVLAVAVPGVARLGRRQTIAVAAPLAGAMLSALYVVRVGGDYMHARFLIPAVFAAFLPISVVDGRALRARQPLTLAIPAVVVLWALVNLVAVPTRGNPVDATGFDQGHFIVNERLLYEGWNGLTMTDMEKYYAVRNITYQLREPLAAHAAGEDVFFRQSGFEYERVPLPAGQGVRVDTFAAGRQGYIYGPDIALFDRFGLTDPVAARLELAVPRDRRPGHEKLTPDDWVWALNTPHGGGSGADQARRALECPDLVDLQTSVSNSLTLSQFLRNVVNAPRLTLIEVPLDPDAAVARFCP